MLVQMRSVVEIIGEVADEMEKYGLKDAISYIEEEMGLRYAIKAEMIGKLLKIIGEESELNESHLEYLQYVIHAPITIENKKKYQEWALKTNPYCKEAVVAYLALLDIQLGTTAAETYLSFFLCWL